MNYQLVWFRTKSPAESCPIWNHLWCHVSYWHFWDLHYQNQLTIKLPKQNKVIQSQQILSSMYSDHPNVQTQNDLLKLNLSQRWKMILLSMSRLNTFHTAKFVVKMFLRKTVLSKSRTSELWCYSDKAQFVQMYQRIWMSNESPWKLCSPPSS